MFKEKSSRSFLKMISWRVCATLTTMALVYLFVGRIDIAVGVGAVEVIVKMLLYYAHERVWNRVKMGKQQVVPFVLWFTGLPCSGKSTLADRTYQYLLKKGYKAERLDGDKVRSIFPQIGFSKEERDGHIRRIGLLASILEKNGVIVVASFVSPYEESRGFVKGLCKRFVEIYVDTPVDECERRDVKGMYKKARSGEIPNFTGISDPYEAPKNPLILINTRDNTIDESFDQIRKYIKKRLI